MRRLTLSLLLLLLLTGIGIWNCGKLQDTSDHLNDLLVQAQAFAEAGDWARAEALTRTAQRDWEAASPYLYVMLRHDYTDEVNTTFQEVLALIQWQEAPEYASANQALVTQVTHFSEAEQLTLKNLL